MYMSMSFLSTHCLNCFENNSAYDIAYHIYEFLHQVIVCHCHTMLTWDEYSEHIITNPLLIRIISAAYTVL